MKKMMLLVIPLALPLAAIGCSGKWDRSENEAATGSKAGRGEGELERSRMNEAPYGSSTTPSYGTSTTPSTAAPGATTPSGAAVGNDAMGGGTSGTIAPGKQADLVVVEGDPSRTIADIRKVETVFRLGVGYDPKALVASVTGRVGLW